MTHRPHLAAASAAVLLAGALVVASATASASRDEHVTWDQVRAALAAAHRPVPTPHPSPSRPPRPSPAPPGSAAVTVVATIPDLSQAIDDPAAPAAVRRAACHQATGLDDESAAPLAACLAHVRETPRHHAPSLRAHGPERGPTRPGA